MYLIYDGQSNTFSKLVYRGGQDMATQTPVDLNEIAVNENDVFIPILWIFGETLVTEYITKVLQTNPFCVKKVAMSDSSVDYMRFSRSRIRSHQIMKWFIYVYISNYWIVVCIFYRILFHLDHSNIILMKKSELYHLINSLIQKSK